MASISGTVIIAGDPVDWWAIALDAATHALAGSAPVAAGAFTITGLTAGRGYLVACGPKTGSAWRSNYGGHNVGDYCTPTDPLANPRAFAATSVVTGDPDFDGVALLLPFDGDNGETNIVDASAQAATITNVGNVALSTAQKRFGTASLVISAQNKHLTIPSRAAYAAPGPFSFEGWFNPVNWSPNSSGVFNIGAYSNFMVRMKPTVTEVFVSNGTQRNFSFSIPTGTYSHIKVARDADNNLRMFLNGTQQGAAQVTTGAIAAGEIRIGTSAHTTAEWFNGSMDDLRFYVGPNVPTDSFTVPAAAHLAYAAIPTAATEPTWPTTIGATVEDGGVIWTCRGKLVRPQLHGPLIAS